MSIKNYRNPLNIKVRCPASQRIEPMQLTFLPTDRQMVLPCQGCENLNGSDVCNRCRTAITLMFKNGLEYFCTDVITPDFSILK
jgi:hypothetical protein